VLTPDPSVFQDALMSLHADSHQPADDDRCAQLVGQVLASYANWRKNATTVAHIHQRSCEAPSSDQAAWCSRYLAALEQEEAAAVVYELDAWDLEGWLQRSQEHSGERRRGPGPAVADVGIGTNGGCRAVAPTNANSD
jgi:hypothetical protein